jgi:hypothetical protein
VTVVVVAGVVTFVVVAAALNVVHRGARGRKGKGEDGDGGLELHCD